MCASATLEPDGAQGLIYTQTDKLLLPWPSNKGSSSLYVNPPPTHTHTKCCLKWNKSVKAQWFGQESQTARFYSSIYCKVDFSLFSGKTMASFSLAVDPGKPDMVSLPAYLFEGFSRIQELYLLSKWLIDFIILYSFKSGRKGRGWEAVWWEGSPLLTALLQYWTPSRNFSFQLCGPFSLSRRKQGILEGITRVPGFLSSCTRKCRGRKDNAGRAIEAKLLTGKQGTMGKTNG